MNAQFTNNLKEIQDDRQRFELTLQYLEHTYYTHWLNEYKLQLDASEEEAYKWARSHVEANRARHGGIIDMAVEMRKDIDHKAMERRRA